MSEEIPAWAEGFIAVKEIRGPVGGSHLCIIQTAEGFDLVARDEVNVHARWKYLNAEDIQSAFDLWSEYPTNFDDFEFFDHGPPSP